MMNQKVFMMTFVILLMTGITVFAQFDITAPGNLIQGVPNDNDWPSPDETPDKAIDNDTGTKFLHFKGETEPTGIAVMPLAPAKIVGAINLTTGNDAPERDPASFELYGSDAGFTGPWTLIDSGGLSLPDGRGESSGWILIDNSTAYSYYRLMFPTVKNASTANSMQIAEIELINKPATGWPPAVDAGDDQVVRIPDTTATMNPTVTDLDSDTFTYSWVEMPGNPGTVNFNGTENQPNATVTLPPTQGIYQLRLDVKDESNNDSNDVVSIRVWDPALEDILVAHWKLNEGTGNIADDSAVSNGKGNDQGLITSRPEGEDPNWTAGWIPSEAPNNYALDFYNFGYVEITAAPDGPDPNFTNLEWAISITAWINAVNWGHWDGPTWVDDNRRILQKGAGDNQYRFLAEWGNFVFDLAGVGRLETALPSAGTWHHMAGTYDGSEMKIFLDGYEVASMEAGGRINLTDDPLFLGTKHKDVTVAGDFFKGKMDDVRVYSYALSSTEVEGLAAMGQNSPPVVTVEQPEDLILSVEDSIQMEATVFDVNGLGNINYNWTGVGPEPVTFNPGNDVEDPQAVFTAAGTYVLRLTVDDGEAGLSGDIFDEVQVTITDPTCADVIALGLNLFGDSNADCRITLIDFAAFAANWLRCVDPQDDSCDNPFE